jgi:hypothetical protein
LEAALLDSVDFVGEQVGQELGVGRPLLFGGLQRRREPVGDRGQPQVVQVPAQLLVDGVGHQQATSAGRA